MRCAVLEELTLFFTFVLEIDLVLVELCCPYIAQARSLVTWAGMVSCMLRKLSDTESTHSPTIKQGQARAKCLCVCAGSFGAHRDIYVALTMLREQNTWAHTNVRRCMEVQCQMNAKYNSI